MNEVSVWLLGLKLPGDVGLVERREVGSWSGLNERTIRKDASVESRDEKKGERGAYDLVLPGFPLRPDGESNSFGFGAGDQERLVVFRGAVSRDEGGVGLEGRVES